MILFGIKYKSNIFVPNYFLYNYLLIITIYKTWFTHSVKHGIIRLAINPNSY